MSGKTSQLYVLNGDEMFQIWLGANASGKVIVEITLFIVFSSPQKFHSQSLPIFTCLSSIQFNKTY